MNRRLGQREYERGIRYRDGHAHTFSAPIEDRTLNGKPGYPYRRRDYCECWIPVLESIERNSKP